MLGMTEYPKDILPVYAQGYTASAYLIDVRSQAAEPKKHFVEFVSRFMGVDKFTTNYCKYNDNDLNPKGDWSRSLKKCYECMKDTSEWQIEWLEWVKSSFQSTELGSAEDFDFTPLAERCCGHKLR